MRLQLMHNARYTAINCGQLNQHKYKLLADTASGRGVWEEGVVVRPPAAQCAQVSIEAIKCADGEAH